MAATDSVSSINELTHHHDLVHEITSLRTQLAHAHQQSVDQSHRIAQLQQQLSSSERESSRRAEQISYTTEIYMMLSSKWIDVSKFYAEDAFVYVGDCIRDGHVAFDDHAIAVIDASHGADMVTALIGRALDRECCTELDDCRTLIIDDIFAHDHIVDQINFHFPDRVGRLLHALVRHIQKLKHHDADAEPAVDDDGEGEFDYETAQARARFIRTILVDDQSPLIHRFGVSPFTSISYVDHELKLIITSFATCLQHQADRPVGATSWYRNYCASLAADCVHAYDKYVLSIRVSMNDHLINDLSSICIDYLCTFEPKATDCTIDNDD